MSFIPPSTDPMKNGNSRKSSVSSSRDTLLVSFIADIQRSEIIYLEAELDLELTSPSSLVSAMPSPHNVFPCQ